jgi:hypothetical protein
MAETRSLRSPQSTAAQPTPPNPNWTQIQIKWGETVAEIIEIRRHHIEVTTKVGGINLKPGCWQGHDVQLALNTQAQKIFASTPERRAP